MSYGGNDQDSLANVSRRMRKAGVLPNRIVIEKFKECVFHQDEVLSYRGVVQTINGQLYVGLSKFFFANEERGWVPTKKHFYMPPEIWKKFAQIVHGLTESCNAATRNITSNHAPPTINGMPPP